LKDKKQYTALLILLFALFAINSAELLHHHDENTHNNDECRACIFSKTLNSTLVTGPSIDLITYYSYDEFLSEDVSAFSQYSFRSFSGRAPPQLSHI
jgi:hypothetical protein